MTVGFATVDGSATAPADYAPASGTLSFAPGDTTETITVDVKGDTQAEPEETFLVDLSSPVNATLARAHGTGTIADDDAVAVSIQDTTVTEGDSGTTQAKVDVTLSARRPSR